MDDNKCTVVSNSMFLLKALYKVFQKPNPLNQYLQLLKTVYNPTLEFDELKATVYFSWKIFLLTLILFHKVSFYNKNLYKKLEKFRFTSFSYFGT